MERELRFRIFRKYERLEALAQTELTWDFHFKVSSIVIIIIIIIDLYSAVRS